MSQTNFFQKENSHGSSKEHTELIVYTLEVLGSRRDMRVWRNETGAYQVSKDKWIKYGLIGSGDIQGIRMGGRSLWIEIKTGNAVQTKEQKNFQAMIESFGGEYHIVRSKEDARAI